MNQDKIKPLLESLDLKITDSWQTIHIIPTKDLKSANRVMCYYHTFKYQNITYCVSGDGISYIFSDENGNYYYQGYYILELEEEINKVINWVIQ